MARMRILTASEQEGFDKPPVYDHRERKRFFNLPKGLSDILATLRTPDSQIGFLLMCGYFKAARRFYQPHDFHESDIIFAARQLNLEDHCFEPDNYTETTRLRHQRHILEFFGFVPFDAQPEEIIAAEIAAMARVHLKPRLIFDRCVEFIIQRRIQVPTSRSLSDMIRSGLQARKTELIALIEANITDEARTLLEQLFTAPDDQSRYRLTLLKKLSQSTKPTRIKER